MKVITEQELRDLYRSSPFSRFELSAGHRLTPAAAQFLSERGIMVEEAGQPGLQCKNTAAPVGKGEKKEHQTHLRGSFLVDKSHPLIKFRGQLDHLQAEVILAVIEARSCGLQLLGDDLSWLLDFLRRLMRAEVTGKALPEISFGGLDSYQIRKYSHYPEDYMGVRHFMPDPDHGIMMGRLNLLRTLARKVELSAVDAFCREDAVEREDLLSALNRASSVLYIMMCRLLSGKYYGLSGKHERKD
ncbi:MAG: hypothetical protein ACOY46_07630 [Bacillota bacterium]